jgi:hypothetical protein
VRLERKQGTFVTHIVFEVELGLPWVEVVEEQGPVALVEQEQVLELSEPELKLEELVLVE